MTSWMVRAAVAMVRVWTRTYTSGLAPDLGEVRRAEIESDLWEFTHDGAVPHRLVAVHIVGRLVCGIPDDLGWRAEHDALRRASWPITVTATTLGVTMLLIGLWVYDGLSPQPLPTAPPVNVFIEAPPPLVLPPPPPPPPPPK
jgi:hypothetical protein